MTTLIEFLEARLAEDEAIAQASIADDQGDDGGLEYEYLTSGRIQRPRFGEPLAKLVTTFAVPRRVLREVEAKRAILADLKIELQDAQRYEDFDSAAQPLRHLGIMAAVYSDHEAYRDEWRI